MATSQYANVSDVPLALAVFLASDYYDHSTDPTEISATTLLKPLRQIILPSRLPEGVGLTNLADMMQNRMGAAIHDGIERAWTTNHHAAMKALGMPERVIQRVVVNPTREQLASNPDLIPVYLEQRLKRKIGKWTVTGKFDFVGEGRVQDFKSTSTWTYMNQVNAEKYAQQGSIYRWLDPQLITADAMDIHYIFMDWKPALAKADPKYPPKRFHKQSYALWPLQETERFIAKKLRLIEQYWDAPEDEIPYCSDEELWRSEPVFKYYKNPEKTARSTKNFDNLADARLRLAEDGGKGLIKEVPGQATACKYCPAFAACTQKDELIRAGDLVMG